jgi:hypothetical protein
MTNLMSHVVRASALFVAWSGLCFPLQSLAGQPRPATLIKISGGVTYQKKSGDSFTPIITQTMKVYQGWIVQLEQGAKASLICPAPPPPEKPKPNEIAPHQLGPYLSSQKIKVVDKCKYVTLEQGDKKRFLGGFEPEVPYIVSPRHTLTFNNKPTLTWNSIPKVTGYEVKIYKDNLGTAEIFDFSSIPLSHTQESKLLPGADLVQIDYPFSKPLQSGVNYRLEVSATTGTNSSVSSKEKINESTYSSDYGFSGLWFKVLEPDPGVKEAINQAQKMPNLPDEVKQSSIAQIYDNYGYTNDAIRILERLLPQTKKPGIYRKLGNLYEQTGLSLLAQAAYLEAIKLAQTGSAENSSSESNQEEIRLACEDLAALHKLMTTQTGAVQSPHPACPSPKVLYQGLPINVIADQK